MKVEGAGLRRLCVTSRGHEGRRRKARVLPDSSGRSRTPASNREEDCGVTRVSEGHASPLPLSPPESKNAQANLAWGPVGGGVGGRGCRGLGRGRTCAGQGCG